MSRLDPKPRSAAVDLLKTAAQRLFAERGVDGVTVREIADAAGQKNHAAVGYHFGSKEALIRQLVLDGAALIDQRRNAWLDRLEAEGGPAAVRDVVDALVRTTVEVDPRATGEETYNRFVVMLGMTHRQFFLDVLGTRWNSGYQRCLEHLRRLLPDMPAETKNERLRFMGAYLGGVLAAREWEIAGSPRAADRWRTGQSLDHLVTTMTAMLEAKD